MAKINLEIQDERELDTLLECLQVFSAVKYNNMNAIVLNIFNKAKKLKNQAVTDRINDLKKQIIELEKSKYEQKAN